MKQAMKQAMKHITVYILALWGFFACSQRADAQLIERAEHLILSAFGHSAADSTTTDPATAKPDSVRIKEMEAQLEQMRLTELELRAELDSNRQASLSADSLRHARMRHHIDSLRAITPGIPVTLDGDTLFSLYANRGGYTPEDRAEMITDALLKIKTDRHSATDSVYAFDTDGYTYIIPVG